MLSNKKIRLLGLSGLTIFLVLVLFRANRQTSRAAELTKTTEKSQVLQTSNNIIDTQNDEKVDDAINKELSKLGKSEVEAESPDDERDDGLSKPKDKSGNKPFEPEEELRQIRSLSPMVIFSKSYCPFSKNLKKLLHDHYQITPEPTIVEIDKHFHGAELQEYLAQVSGRKTVPNVLVGSSIESRGGSDDFVKLHNEGKLLDSLTEWGDKKLDVKQAEAPSNL